MFVLFLFNYYQKYGGGGGDVGWCSYWPQSDFGVILQFGNVLYRNQCRQKRPTYTVYVILYINGINCLFHYTSLSF